MYGKSYPLVGSLYTRKECSWSFFSCRDCWNCACFGNQVTVKTVRGASGEERRFEASISPSGKSVC